MQPADAREPARQSSITRLLAKLSPAKDSSRGAQPPEQRGIPAFRPPSPPPHALLAPRADSSPCKAQLRAVRSLGRPAQQQQQPLGTPGVSEAINAQIASSVADLFMPTPAAPAPCSDAQHTPGSSECSSSGGCSAVDDCGTAEAQHAGGMPSVLSPVFMSRKRRPMTCEMDEPGGSIPFPRSHRRTGRLQRWVAGAFGCFVPPPERHSPAASYRAPGSRGAGSSQGGSPLRPSLAYRVEPLRQSLAGLTMEAADGDACGEAAPQRFADLLGVLPTYQAGEEDDGQHMNMASPVLPSRPGSRSSTPAEQAREVAPAGGGSVLAKRNLMHVLRSKDGGTVQPTAVLQAQQSRQRQQQPAGKQAHKLAGPARETHVSLAQLLGAPGAAPPVGGRGGRATSAAGLCKQPSTDGAPGFTPKRRDLSKPSYRSHALHRMLSPQRGQRAVAQGPGTLRQSASAPASPLRSVAAAPTAAAVNAGRAAGGYSQAGRSVPNSPLQEGPRLTRAATVRAAASQRKLQERDAQGSAFMAKSPDRWLRAAAAEGLSLRQAAVLASPGKSARRHYSPSPPARRTLATGRQGPAGVQGLAAVVAAAAAGAGTPGLNRFDPFELGSEPYSARLHTADKRQPAPQAAGPPTAPQQQAPEPGSVDFVRLAADRDAYLSMLQMLAEGLQVEPAQLDAHKQPTPPPLPADLLAGAAASSQAAQQRRPVDDGADTVRPRLEGGQGQTDGQDGRELRRSRPSTAEYSLHLNCSHASLDLPDEPDSPPKEAAPHHNALYGREATPSKSSPVALQRMVSMSTAAQHAEQQQRRQPGGGSRQASSNAVSSSARSISFGSAGCRGHSDARQKDSSAAGSCSSTAQAQHHVPARRCSGQAGAVQSRGMRGGNVRLSQLVELLEEEQQAGRRCGLRELQEAGFSTQDLAALKQWLARQR